MDGAQATLLADGRRIHLHHGPIDLIIEAFGPGRNHAYTVATRRFQTVLEELVTELPLLRNSVCHGTRFSGTIAKRMQRAVEPYFANFVTPMAAVAGAVADEILHHIKQVPDLDKAYVNNGGDVAFYLTEGQTIKAAMPALPQGIISLGNSTLCRGVATSGWSGRSYSLGIADSVSVVATNAAAADAAATMIANAVNIPGHPNIKRTPADELSPDSDLGDMEVTTYVGDLSIEEIEIALEDGAKTAQSYVDGNLIGGAVLQLKHLNRQVGASAIQASMTNSISKRELIHA